MEPQLVEYNARDCVATRLCWDPLWEDAQEAGVAQFYRDLVLPLATAVSRMAGRGLLVDPKRKRALIGTYGRVLARVQTQLPPGLNADSPKQIGTWLQAQGFRLGRRTVGGQFSVDEEVLRGLLGGGPNPHLEAILAYRETTKLLRTYLANLRVDPDGRVRGRWLVHGTATGRLSSREPNFQNIPDDLRCIYVAPAGWRLAELDYDQIELRLIAHIAQAQGLLESFATGRDEHGLNAQFMFGLPRPAKKGSAERDWAKIPVYGIILYGGNARTVPLPPKMLQTLPDGRRSVQRWVDWYLAKQHEIATWRGAIAKEVGEKARLYNWAGRMRIFMGHDHDRIREGYNFPIQGGAADIINKVLIALDEGERILAQVHDSLLMEYQRSREVESVKAIMERPVVIDGRPFSCPVSVKTGTRWGELT